MFDWDVGLRGWGREGDWLSAMARIGSMSVGKEKKMVGMGLCKRGDRAMWERKRETERGMGFCGFNEKETEKENVFLVVKYGLEFLLSLFKYT